MAQGLCRRRRTVSSPLTWRGSGCGAELIGGDGRPSSSGHGDGEASPSAPMRFRRHAALPKITPPSAGSSSPSSRRRRLRPCPSPRRSPPRCPWPAAVRHHHVDVGGAAGDEGLGSVDVTSPSHGLGGEVRSAPGLVRQASLSRRSPWWRYGSQRSRWAGVPHRRSTIHEAVVDGEMRWRCSRATVPRKITVASDGREAGG